MSHAWEFVERVPENHRLDRFPDRWRCTKCGEFILLTEGTVPGPEENYWTWGVPQHTPTCEESQIADILES